MIAPKSGNNLNLASAEVDERYQSNINPAQVDDNQAFTAPATYNLSTTEQPVAPSYHSAASRERRRTDEESLNESSTALARLKNRKTELRFYKERLNELEWDQDEERFARDLLLERGDEPSIPEDEFEQTYWHIGNNIERDIEAANIDIARSEEECRAEGVDYRTPRRSPSSLGYKSEGNEQEIEVEMRLASTRSRPSMRSNENADQPLGRHYSAGSLSVESLAGASQDEDQVRRLQQWVNQSATVDQQSSFYDPEPEQGPMMDSFPQPQAEEKDLRSTELQTQMDFGTTVAHDTKEPEEHGYDDPICAGE